jgi:hypothetical protein
MIGHTTRRLAVVTLLLTMLSAMAVASEPETTAGPASPPPTVASVAWLSGTFGAVAGGPPNEPATAEPDARALDTWMRRASLELASDPPLDSLARSEVVARLADGTGPEEVLARGERWFMAPDAAGRYILTATLETVAGVRSEHSWLVDVPDRQGSWETLLEMPMLSAELRSSGGAVSSEPGHGCYVGMCQEVGLRPPPDALEALPIEIGETPELHLVDGSALLHWQGRLEPLSGTLEQPRLAQATFDRPEAGPLLAGLEPITAGDWLLEVRVDYDRERGWQWFLFRLLAE